MRPSTTSTTSTTFTTSAPSRPFPHRLLSLALEITTVVGCRDAAPTAPGPFAGEIAEPPLCDGDGSEVASRRRAGPRDHVRDARCGQAAASAEKRADGDSHFPPGSRPATRSRRRGPDA